MTVLLMCWASGSQAKNAVGSDRWLELVSQFGVDGKSKIGPLCSLIIVSTTCPLLLMRTVCGISMLPSNSPS